MLTLFPSDGCTDLPHSGPGVSADTAATTGSGEAPYNIGDMVGLSCNNPGYKIASSEKITCLSTQRWSDTEVPTSFQNLELGHFYFVSVKNQSIFMNKPIEYCGSHSLTTYSLTTQSLSQTDHFFYQVPSCEIATSAALPAPSFLLPLAASLLFTLLFQSPPSFLNHVRS